MILGKSVRQGTVSVFWFCEAREEAVSPATVLEAKSATLLSKGVSWLCAAFSCTDAPESKEAEQAVRNNIPDNKKAIYFFARPVLSFLFFILRLRVDSKSSEYFVKMVGA